jgi:hypothetical protein
MLSGCKNQSPEKKGREIPDVDSLYKRAPIVSSVVLTSMRQECEVD